MCSPLEETHHITLERFPGAFLARLIPNDGESSGIHGIGDHIPDALRDLERNAGDNIAVVPIRLSDGRTFGIVASFI